MQRRPIFFAGLADDTVNLTVTTADDLNLTVLVSDFRGVPLGQAVDATGSGTVVIPAVTLEEDGRYFVVVFDSAGGSGSFDLTLGSGELDVTPAPVVTDPPADATATPTAAPIAETEQPAEVLLANGLRVTLTWESSADMNLQVRDPSGQTLYWDSRSTSNGGAFGFDANGLCEVISDNPAETATWSPGFLPTGSWEILIFYRQACDTASPVPFTATISVNGSEIGTINSLTSATFERAG